MRSHLASLTALSFVLLSLAAPAVAQEEEQDRVIVQFRALDENARGAVRSAGGTILLELPQVNAVAARVPPQAQQGLARNPHVTLVEPDGRRYLNAETIPWGIARVGADRVWDKDRNDVLDAGAPSGAGQLVCVIDSGISTAHPDLSGMVVGGYPSGWSTDGCGHGTHVAGTIAAKLNGSGIPGVAPGARMYAVKVFGNDCGWTYASSLVDAAHRCRAAGAKIISMSLGGSTKSKTEESAFNDLYSNYGILSIAAAGNSGSTAFSYPASYASVVSVAATDSSDRKASFSQYNSQVELAAPGVAILSTVPWGSGYESWNGTSMATPHVSGAAALAWSARASLTAAEVRQLLRDTALDLGTAGRDSSFGFGLVQAKAAVDRLLGTSNAAPAVTVSAPSAGSAVAVGTAVVFSGSALDAEEGDLSASLVWTSDRDGVIGTGASFTTTALTAGTHVVTAAVTDSAGETGAAQVTLTVQAEDATPPVLTNVAARVVNKKGGFEITWTTNEAADTRVRFTCCGVFTDGALVTSHRMAFTGNRGVTYEYFVSSADAAGNVSREYGPYYVKP